MGLASLRLEIGIFCDFLHSVFLLGVILGVDFLGLALSRPQARLPAADHRRERPGEGHYEARARGDRRLPHVRGFHAVSLEQFSAR